MIVNIASVFRPSIYDISGNFTHAMFRLEKNLFVILCIRILFRRVLLLLVWSRGATCWLWWVKDVMSLVCCEIIRVLLRLVIAITWGGKLMSFNLYSHVRYVSHCLGSTWEFMCHLVTFDYFIKGRILVLLLKLLKLFVVFCFTNMTFVHFTDLTFLILTQIWNAFIFFFFKLGIHDWANSTFLFI